MRAQQSAARTEEMALGAGVLVFLCFFPGARAKCSALPPDVGRGIRKPIGAPTFYIDIGLVDIFEIQFTNPGLLFG